MHALDRSRALWRRPAEAQNPIPVPEQTAPVLSPIQRLPDVVTPLAHIAIKRHPLGGFEHDIVPPSEASVGSTALESDDDMTLDEYYFSPIKTNQGRSSSSPDGLVGSPGIEEEDHEQESEEESEAEAAVPAPMNGYQGFAVEATPQPRFNSDFSAANGIRR